MINKERLENRIYDLAEIGKVGEMGVSRLAHSIEDKIAVEIVRKWMEEVGLETRIDNFGNLIGRLAGKDNQAPVIMLGSHIDSQPNGGRYDGIIGVLGALEVVESLKEQGIIPDRAIEVVSFSDEEGPRFNKPLFGSRGITGKVENKELDRLDKDGVSRKQALIEFGCDPARLSESVYPENSIYAYLEMHIEQGPNLEAKDSPVGIVTGIAGLLWKTVTLKGFAGHAGSVPTNLRSDALVGAAELIIGLQEYLKDIDDLNALGTVGSLKVHPNSINIIPDKVEFTIDLRDIDDNRKKQCEKDLLVMIENIANKYQLKYEIREDMRTEAKYCAESIQKLIGEESGELNINAPRLMSGPSHDARSLSEVCDYGMIFVRCKDGISHNPLEFARMDDIAIGTELLYRTVNRIMKH